ncbi:MAG TPA: alpha/beta hydrolase [Rugosimonospora sp.]
MDEFDLWTTPPLRAGTGEADAAGEADRPTLTAFTVPAPRPVPAVLVVPGGGYSRNAEHEGAPVARWLNSLGVSAFVLRYRVAPYRYPVPLLDGQRAIRYIRHHADRFGIDPGRVGVLGFSAGGHLAGLLATAGRGAPERAGSGSGDTASGGAPDFVDELSTSDGQPADGIDREDPRPDLAVLCYPVASLVGPVHRSSMENLLGPEPDGALRRRLSVEHRITPTSPPTFLWHTADDPVVDAENARLVADALARHTVPHEVHIYPHGPHGLGLADGVPTVSDWTDRCAAFLRNQGW